MTIVELTSPQLTADQRCAVLELDDRFRRDHGREGLVEQARFALVAGNPAIHLLSFERDDLTGYAQVTLSERDAIVEFLGSSPSSDLIDAAVHVARRADRAPALWLHGLDVSESDPFGSAFVVDRSILRLHRSTSGVATPTLPPGFSIRPFEMGLDDEAWLALNARSFAELPDQGSWGPHDLEQRFGAAWFDPDGFLVLESNSQMIGFCWTKLHDEEPEAIGEIYVIGVDPEQAGQGLGRSLVEAGIAHLAARAIHDVILYVDADNAAARRLYDHLGFDTKWVDERFVANN